MFHIFMSSRLARRRRCIAMAVAAVLGVASAALAIPAFPGADGAGQSTVGGRGGLVYHVTQLDTGYGQGSVPGTLQYGLNDSNFGGAPRTIVFDVGGTIWFGRYPTDTAGWDSQDRISVGSNITIAGQTAPGGIFIAGGTLKVNGNQAIIRNVTIAPGYGTRGIGADGIPDSYVYDAINIHAQHVMIDHVSAVFATDEAISADEFANHATVQYSNVSQGQNYPQMDTDGKYTGHAFGSLWQPGSNAVTSIHHNLYAHQKGRLPRVGSAVGTGAYNDFRNNVIYNWLSTAGTGASGQPSYNNFVGNFYLAGPGGDNPVGGTSTDLTWTNGGTSIFNGNSTSATRVYHSGNVKDTNKDGDANDGVALTNSDFGSSTFVGSPYSAGYTGVTDAATVAYGRVLDYVGANWWDRNQIDARIVAEVRSGTGQIMAWNDATHGTEWNWLMSLKAPAGGGIGGTGIYARPAGWDSDNDGMPDAWEVARGLNPNLADNNGDDDADGYTNLEEYLNEIAAWPAPRPLLWTGGNGRYALISNWDIPWQPSRFDTAQIRSGTATVDAMGQDAKILQVAPLAGDTATLAVTAGRIAIAEQLQVGAAGNGTVNQNGGIVSAGQAVVLGGSAGASGVYNLSGGVLLTPLLSRGASGGVFNFTGGVLHADRVAFSLVNAGGTISPGLGIGSTAVTGNLTLSSGTVRIEVDSSASYDVVAVSGTATLGGTLQIMYGGGAAAYDKLAVLTYNARVGRFASISGNQIGDGLVWAVLYEAGAVKIAPALAGDADWDRTVGFADLLVLSQNYNATGRFWNEGDSDGDGVVGFADLLALSQNYNITLPAPAAVPEPSAVWLVLAAGLGLRRRSRT